MANTIEVAVKNGAIDYYTAHLNAGAGAGKIKLFTGETLIATFTLSDPAAGAASSNLATFGSIAGAAAVAVTPAIDKARFYDSDDVLKWERTVGQTEEYQVILPEIVVTAIGQMIYIDTATITIPDIA